MWNDDEAGIYWQLKWQEIEQKFQYPGEIKVNVIREVRQKVTAR